MRNWFPFTDYDFYGYLTSGFTIMFALDVAFNSGDIVLHSDWTFVQVILAVAFAYAVGQLAAWPSSMLLEHFFARTLLHSPFDVQVRAASPRFVERAINKVVTGQGYLPLGDDALEKMVARASTITGKPASYYEEKPGRLFQPAYEFAKSMPDTRERMDNFRNLYGLTRNLAFVGLVSAAMLALGAGLVEGGDLGTWAVVALAAGVGMLARYLKFYSAFASEVTRSFAYREPKEVSTDKS